MATRRNSVARICLLLPALALAVRAPNAASAQESVAARPQVTAIEVGLAKTYKVGHWTPVRVSATGLSSSHKVRIEATVIDSDGVETTSSAPIQTATVERGDGTATVYTKVGRVGAPIRVSLMDRESKTAQTILRPDTGSDSETASIELPPTAELIAVLGSDQIGLRQAFPDREATSGEFARRVIQLKSMADLPTEWFGYDAVDVLVISASEIEACRQLAADPKRFAALVKWVELGGRLVFLCGGGNATELLADGEPLASLLPGRIAEVVRLTETAPLEQFAEPAEAIPGRGAGSTISIPRLVDVTGAVEARAGQRPTDPPLVVRSARGLGQITFAGVNLSEPQLADWADRNRFLQALLRPYISASEPQDGSQALVARGYNDLSGALRQRLGRSFTSLAPIGFPLVALLALAYLFVLGPLDYLFVQRWFRQPLVAWITFPIIVLAFGVGATLLAKWRERSTLPQVNQLELVDVDMATGIARGNYWASLHSPQARQFDLSLRVPPRASQANSPTTLLSWWGLPGSGIGGMQTRAANLGIVQDGYRYAADLAELEAVPVLKMSTKSLTARWTSPVATLLEANLIDQDGMASGSILNKTGHDLRNVRLFYRNWGYRLGNLAIDRQIDIGEHLEPRSAKTILTTSALSATATISGQSETGMFFPDRASELALLNVMMFYEAAGGSKFALLPNRLYADCDWSEMLRPGIGRAVLVAEVPGAGSQLIDESNGEAVDDDFAMVVYRFAIPVMLGRDSL